jgi:methyl-accepting chemotaxis protein
MFNNWTFGRRTAAGFAFVVALTILVIVLAINALQDTVAEKDRVIEVYGQNIRDAQHMALISARETIQIRGYLIDRRKTRLDEIDKLRTDFGGAMAKLRTSASTEAQGTALDRIQQADATYQAAVDRMMDMRSRDLRIENVAKVFDDELVPSQNGVTTALDALLQGLAQAQEQAKQAATAAANEAIVELVVVAVLAVLAAIFAATILTRALARQIGSAVGQVQSSSAELQAAANQQASSATEQATAMNQIATTMQELLATSRQIAESAQRVSQVADQTAGTARSGDSAVNRTTDSVALMKRQVDLIVNHMLDLGKKSQQIGAVLDIVSELAEQTNILAINATIEAAGAGESGKRFVVVADEIRKLADRVKGSTKEIRGLIEEVRGAVNTTVMTTETGSKAVDAGARHFSELTSFFKQIVEMVLTTMQAAREIELSTKQQTTAVEQVNLAIANVAQATRETESSSTQTLQTASQMASLSQDLLRMVRPQNA